MFLKNFKNIFNYIKNDNFKDAHRELTNIIKYMDGGLGHEVYLKHIEDIFNNEKNKQKIIMSVFDLMRAFIDEVNKIIEQIRKINTKEAQEVVKQLETMVKVLDTYVNLK